MSAIQRSKRGGGVERRDTVSMSKSKDTVSSKTSPCIVYTYTGTECNSKE